MSCLSPAPQDPSWTKPEAPLSSQVRASEQGLYSRHAICFLHPSYPSKPSILSVGNLEVIHGFCDSLVTASHQSLSSPKILCPNIPLIPN